MQLPRLGLEGGRLTCGAADPPASGGRPPGFLSFGREWGDRFDLASYCTGSKGATIWGRKKKIKLLRNANWPSD